MTTFQPYPAPWEWADSSDPKDRGHFGPLPPGANRVMQLDAVNGTAVLTAVEYDEQADFPGLVPTDSSTAEIIAEAPWVRALFWALTRGWNLEKTLLYDEEGVEGACLASPDGREWSWISDWSRLAPEFDQKAYLAIRSASGETV